MGRMISFAPFIIETGSEMSHLFVQPNQTYIVPEICIFAYKIVMSNQAFNYF